MKHSLNVLFCWGLLLGLPPTAQAAGEECPARVRIAFADSAAEPLIYGDGEHFAEPPGVGVDWTRAALRKLGCFEQAELVRLPVARIRLMMATDPPLIDIVPGVVEGSPNAQVLVMPPTSNGTDLSMGQVDFSLFARPADASAWNNRRLVAKPGQLVGVMRGTPAEFLAREQGWPLELAPSYDSAFNKFMAGRSSFLFVFAPFMEGRQRADLPEAERWVRLEPAVLSRRFHVAVAPDFFRGEPDFVRRLWVEVCLQGNAMRSKPLKCSLPTTP